MDLSAFILEHENDDTAALVLARNRWPETDVALAAECIQARRKLKSKVPGWYANPRIICPSALSAEQCSSTATADYKAALAAKILRLAGKNPGESRIADLTGGLGVDAWSFSAVAGKVLYNEMNPLLVSAAKGNFPLLGRDNISFSGLRIDASSLPGLLDGFRPDLVYIDPARRGEGGRKVFMPEDCTPDVLALQDTILERGIPLMLKLSPMADISLMIRKFHSVKELHAVQADGECKELLLVLEPGFAGDPAVKAVDAGSPEPKVMGFDFSRIASAKGHFMGSSPLPGQILFEPGPALSKCGAFNLVSDLLDIPLLGPDAHYYCIPGNDGDKEVFRALEGLGKWYSVIDAAPFGNASVKAFASRWPDAEATARALPLTSEALRVKMKLRGGGLTHIFALGTAAGRLLIAAERYSPDLH